MDIKERAIKLLVTDNGDCPFQEWFQSLRDRRAVSAVRGRLVRARIGNFGDWKAIDSGVCEMRIDLGPGYRIYFALHEDTLVVLLAGGDKNTQDKDIQKAIALWKAHKDETERFSRDF